MAVEFKDYSVKVKKLLENKALQLLTEGAIEIKAQVSKNTKSKKGTGELKRSWNYILDNSDLEAKIGSPLEHAIYQELGTGEWALNNNGRKPPWYVPIGNGSNQMPLEVAERYGFKIVYGKNGMKFAEVSGQRPERPLYKAFETSKGKIERRAKTIFGG